jgi:hypothetical protein
MGLYQNKTLLFSSTKDILEESIAKFDNSYFKGIEIITLPEKELLKIEGKAPYIIGMGEAATKRKTWVISRPTGQRTATVYNSRNNLNTGAGTGGVTSYAHLNNTVVNEDSVTITEVSKLHCTQQKNCIHLSSSNCFCFKYGKIALLPGDKCSAKLVKMPRKMKALAGNLIKMKKDESIKFKFGKTHYLLTKARDKFIAKLFVIHISMKLKDGSYKELYTKIYGMTENTDNIEREDIQRKLTQFFYPAESS